MSRIERCEKFESLDHPPQNRSQNDFVRLAAVGKMTGCIVRDFENLMQIIRSAVRLIEQKLDRSALDDVEPFIQGALQSVNQATALSRKLLGVLRTDCAFEEAVHISSALASIKVPISWRARSNIHVELVLGDDLPAVFCNAREFENVVLSLVINAREAMPNGGRLRLSAVRHDLKDGTTVVLCATGTSSDMSSEIAEPAFPSAFTTMPAGRGSEFGLARVSEFARHVGGSVRIESTLNRSTSVTLRLPAYRK